MFEKKVIQKICQSCGCRYEEPLLAYRESDVDLSHGICNTCLETKYCRRCGDGIRPPEGMDEGMAIVPLCEECVSDIESRKKKVRDGIPLDEICPCGYPRPHKHEHECQICGELTSEGHNHDDLLPDELKGKGIGTTRAMCLEGIKMKKKEG
jgi:hypothetical protein